MFGSFTARLPRLGTWPRAALVACCLLLALDSAVIAHARTAAPSAVPVVVAARALPAGHRVSPTDIRIVHWPRTVRAAADLRRRADAVGRRLSAALTPGEPVSSTRLIGSDLTAGLPAGQVVTAVQLADPHAGDLLRTGDRVALYAVPRAADDLDPAASTTGPASPASPAADAPQVLAGGLRVLALVPGSDQEGAEIVVAAAPSTAARIAQAAASKTIDAVGEPP
ncbi:SAF domain-containing protein [uncultured Jatrophihabitans sp.]|uniref:SAF domain-containing protein n=1 Tax=uncultured Jatrophihabitans sp. TaxID=1610747 RepID=UPI0035C95846